MDASGSTLVKEVEVKYKKVKRRNVESYAFSSIFQVEPVHLSPYAISNLF